MIIEVTWQDIYTANNTNIGDVIAGLGKDEVHSSIGRLVYEDKKYIILLQNSCSARSDYIVIPKGVILKIRKYAGK